MGITTVDVKRDWHKARGQPPGRIHRAEDSETVIQTAAEFIPGLQAMCIRVTGLWANVTGTVYSLDIWMEKIQ